MTKCQMVREYLGKRSVATLEGLARRIVCIRCVPTCSIIITYFIFW